jgi:hypothetical protein
LVTNIFNKNPQNGTPMNADWRRSNEIRIAQSVGHCVIKKNRFFCLARENFIAGEIRPPHPALPPKGVVEGEFLKKFSQRLTGKISNFF